VKPEAILHGVFRCAGEERWIAIEIEDETQWSGLMEVLAKTGELGAGLSGPESWTRLERVDIERAVEDLTVGWDAFELMDALRAAGVPAGVALKGSDLLNDPTLRERGHFWRLEHPEMGSLEYNGPAYRFSDTPSRLTRAAPCLGEDSAAVLADVLGFSSSQIDDFQKNGLLA
jgi:benzylsuccinate CoA-transferase BbsF subunit